MLSKHIRKQRNNPKSIPIIINNFNQLFYLKQLIDGLLERGYYNIVIIDNNSTYAPLLNYYHSIKNTITIYQLATNDGHLSFWKQDDLVKKYTKGYYVVTDADIVPLEKCPDDFVKTLIQLLDKAYNRTKVGLSLKIDNIPNENPQAQTIRDWESKFWRTKIHSKAYKAEIDTTFALYRPGYKYLRKGFTKAWRTCHPLQAIHGGWYIDPENMTNEQKYYQQTANISASWLVNDKGELKDDFHNRIYSKNEK